MEAARPATPDDLDRLAALAEAGRAELAPTRGGAVWAAREARARPVERSLASAITDPDQLAAVGTIDGTVVGYAVTRLEQLQDGTTLGVIDDLFVEPGAREVGVGEALIDEVIAWCRDRGCRGIDGLALPGNRDTKNFFETFGFTARAIVVHRRLEEPGP
ncbi:MAG: GNAT family N-acetyltransferase [Acidimicrobiales bacterium]|nr:GNAT family N-acetyltransferase [Acidimicrobiales bacterium]